MQRKINSVGTGTLTMSLPMDWVKKNKLRKGDLLHVRETVDGNLDVSVSEPREEFRSVELESEGLTPYLRKLVAGFYKSGYDQVKVRYTKQEELDRIQSVLGYTCIGFEIMEIRKNTVTIRSVSSVKVEEFHEVYKKLFTIILGTCEDIYSFFSKNDLEALQSTILRHKLINRYADFCRRTINQTPGRFPPAGALYSILETLEKISDHYRAFTEDVVNGKVKPSKTMVSILRKTNAYVERSKSLFYKYDHKSMMDFIEGRRALNKELIPSKLKLRKDEIMLFFYCKLIIQLAYDMNGPITTMSV